MGELAKLSTESFGINLAAFHTLTLTTDLATYFTKVSSAVLKRALVRVSIPGPPSSISIQFSTREVMPDNADDILRIEAIGSVTHGHSACGAFDRMLTALIDVKHEVSSALGRPRIKLHGSKHLSSAFAFGRVFAPFELDIRQSPTQVWATDSPNLLGETLDTSVVGTKVTGGPLLVEIAFGCKDVSSGVDNLLKASATTEITRLSFRAKASPIELIDGSSCRAMVKQVYGELDRVVNMHHPCEIHLFAAVPQSFMMMLGREFRGMPPVCLYEWVGGQYVRCGTVPAGPL